MKRLLFIFISSVLGYINAYTQFDTLCKDDLVDYYTNMKSVKAVNEKQTFFIDYSVISDFANQSNFPSQTIDIKAFLTGKLVVVESNIVSAFIDETDAFAISHDQKIIYRSEGNMNPAAETDIQKLFEQQLKLLNSSTIESCFTDLESTRTFRYTRFKLDKETSGTFKMSSFGVWFDLELKMIYKVEMNYLEGQALKKQTIIYNTIDTDYKPQLKGRARDRVLNSNGSLVSKYKGYTFINN